MTKDLLYVYALQVTELQDFFAYIQSDTGSEKNNNIDLPPTLQRTPRFHHHEKTNQLLRG